MGFRNKVRGNYGKCRACRTLLLPNGNCPSCTWDKEHPAAPPKDQNQPTTCPLCGHAARKGICGNPRCP